MAKEKGNISKKPYDILLNCSRKNDITEWNEWRKANPNRTIRLRDVDFSKANLSEANLHDVDMHGADLRNSNFKNANMTGVVLEYANLRYANLRSAQLSEANIRSADLSWANLAKAKVDGAELSNAYLNGAYLGQADLHMANLTEANLIRVNLDRANLSGANLSKANLQKSSLRRANLREATLIDAYLFESDLKGADLRNSNLSLARFVMTDLSHSIVNNALVTDIQIKELKGLPKVPNTLRKYDGLKELVFTGVQAKTFFKKARIFRRFSETQYDMLKRCSDNIDITEWNEWRERNPRIQIQLEGANLSDSKLVNAKLNGANLWRANFNRADLTGADLNQAQLSGANLSKANLVNTKGEQANFCRSDLRGADLSKANLSRANFRRALLHGAMLNGAELSGACFWKAYLVEVSLREAKLTDVELWGTILIKSDLTDCDIDNALVKDIFMNELKGLPRTPKILRLGWLPEARLLTGFEVETFFKLLAIVEVYLTEKLSQRELACFNLHLAEMHDLDIGNDIYLVGHRYESKGSVLRFQGPDYSSIYRVMPDLLSPFRMAGAVDWQKSIHAVPAEDRDEAITTLAKLETSTYEGTWRFAERMADFFRTYARARIYQISEEGRHGVRIDVYTDQGVADRLSRIALPPDFDRRELMIVTGDNPTIQEVENINMSNVRTEGDGNIIASGTSVTINARDISVFKEIVDRSATFDADLKEKLKEAREAVDKLNLPTADKEDVTDQLSKITSELDKPKPDIGRVERFWSRIKDVAPTVAIILQTAETISKLLGH